MESLSQKHWKEFITLQVNKETANKIKFWNRKIREKKSYLVVMKVWVLKVHIDSKDVVVIFKMEVLS